MTTDQLNKPIVETNTAIIRRVVRAIVRGAEANRDQLETAAGERFSEREWKQIVLPQLVLQILESLPDADRFTIDFRKVHITPAGTKTKEIRVKRADGTEATATIRER
jgi:hypothetical protein